MKKFIILLAFLGAIRAEAQLRAFDNSKSFVPWIYNPAVNLNNDLQAYVGYDGRGNSNFTPQSIVAGIRMPVLPGGRHARRNELLGMLGVQMLNTNQDILKSSTVHISYAHHVYLSKQTKLGFGIGAGIFNLSYNTGSLVYVDQQDPLLNNGANLVHMHLNTGVSLVFKDVFLISFAAPYLVKDNATNIDEIIFRSSYRLTLNRDFTFVPAVNLDTYNRTVIAGADVRLEWRKAVALLLSGDNYKYAAGMHMNLKNFSLGYMYGENFNAALARVPAHQIVLHTNLPMRR